MAGKSFKHDEGNDQLFCEVVNYDYKDAARSSLQMPISFKGIQTIRFRSLDTEKLLKAVIIKDQSDKEVKSESVLKVGEPIEVIEETIKVPISMLEFSYGVIRFRYFSQQLYQQISFEIRNEHVRPEFEVLKPYFVKTLKSKKMRIGIRIETQNGYLIRQEATSFDLEQLNQDIIEGMKFQFVKKEILGGENVKGALSILNLKECLNSHVHPLYQSEHEFLTDILKWKKVKHYQQLKYLARKHEVSVLKIRFILAPFSFIFLLAGEKNYYVILETLDTEEATYIWCLTREPELFQQDLMIIDNAITQLRSEGRQVYLDSNPHSFFRIVHDYSNPDKGFVSWMALLEERMI